MKPFLEYHTKNAHYDKTNKNSIEIAANYGSPYGQ